MQKLFHGHYGCLNIQARTADNLKAILSLQKPVSVLIIINIQTKKSNKY